MTQIPMASGRSWDVIPSAPLPGATNNGAWLREVGDSTARAWFKWVNVAKPNSSSMYSFGVERATAMLAMKLGLPVPHIHLEQIDGRDGLLAMKVPGVPWTSVDDETFEHVTFSDREFWPVYIIFDILVANHDRHGGNLFVEWNPPMRRKIVDGEQIALWLIDFGWSGLWPVHKFGENLRASELESISPNAGLRDDYKHAIRNNMPVPYRKAFPLNGSEAREEALAKVREIADADIEEVVREVPSLYLSNNAARLTIEFLCGRLASIDTLVADVFPM